MRTLVLHREETAQGPLILVNAAHPLAPGYLPELTAADCRFPGIQLERQAAHLLTAGVQRARDGPCHRPGGAGGAHRLYPARFS